MQEIEVIEPIESHPAPVAVKKPKIKRITDARLDKALTELNMVSISARGLRNFSAIGRFLDQIGITEYGNGRLVGTAEAIQGAIALCAGLVAKQGEGALDVETKERFLTLQLRLCSALERNVSLLSRINHTSKPGKPAQELQNRPFAVAAAVTPIQIVVGPNTKIDSVAQAPKDQ